MLYPQVNENAHIALVAGLCHFVFRLFALRYGAAKRRNNAKRTDKIMEKRNAKERKD